MPEKTYGCFLYFLINLLVHSHTGVPKKPIHASATGERLLPATGVSAMSSENPFDKYAAQMRRQARRLTQRRLAQPADAQQLQAIVLSVTGELHDFEKGGSAPWRLPEILDRLSARIERALARERGRARSGHRSYDFNRHIALHQALLTLERLESSSRRQRGQKQKAGPKGPAFGT